MNYIIFGGSGFIGTHLIHLLNKECVKPGDKIYDLDIVMPGEEGVVPGVVEKNEGVEYIRLDVRKSINFEFSHTPDDIIFNLAAVHRTPGHPDKAYFETNIRGAENVVAFAEEHGIKKILFTSSIAPYGAAEELKKEATLPMPNTPYGISKLVAEKIHIGWVEKENDRELTIVRPGIVYGKGEHGNMTRLYKGIKGHYYFYAGRKDTVKACIYVKELVQFMKYHVIDNSFKGYDIINCTFEPAFTIEQICEAMKASTDLKGKKIPQIPGGLLIAAATVLGPIGGKKVGINPARVKKLMVSTNISGKKLARMDYKFHYTLGESFKDWFLDCNKEGLF
ncbi:NAD(P)-dependent oxidoreductase [Ruminococcus sp.]|uniref:NAD-dependent epimerase/dehydratase family protein n=1 Tax=Ruminococcus sp. TaxID=41978 RepID=UPI0025DB5D40|nr:NAD(P)-dependent oxidoreductase [Ruminococcus sp.]